MSRDPFEGFTCFIGCLGVLCVLGALTVFFGIGAGIGWLVNHVSIHLH